MIRKLELRRGSRTLGAEFDDGMRADIPLDLLRARSPSAETPPDPPRVGVAVSELQPVGNYAVRPVFSDGHSAGIYSWELLREIAEEVSQNPASSGSRSQPSPGSESQPSANSSGGDSPESESSGGES